MEAEGVASMELPPRTKSTRQQKRLSQWEVIRAARAFYGRPLGPEDLLKIRAAQEVVSQPRLRALPTPDHVKSMHRAGQGDVQQPAIEGAA